MDYAYLLRDYAKRLPGAAEALDGAADEIEHLRAEIRAQAETVGKLMAQLIMAEERASQAEARLETARGEIEILRAELEDAKKTAEANLGAAFRHIDADAKDAMVLHEKLAESQAREEKLRAMFLTAIEFGAIPPFSLESLRKQFDSLVVDGTVLRERLAAERERIAKWFEQRAREYAHDFGHDDMGALSFGQGASAEVMMDYYTELLENATAIRSMGDASD